MSEDSRGMREREQREVLTRVQLLNRRGELAQPGFATHMLFEYEKRRVKGFPFRLKEWDFYQFSLGDWVLQMTIGHVSYVTQISANLFSLVDGKRYEFSRMYPFQRKELDFSADPELPGRLEIAGTDYRMRFDTYADHKRLRLKEKDRVDIDLYLPWDPSEEKMVIATPFEKQNQFYLNCKEHYYGVKGHVRFEDVTVRADDHQTGLLDWGRGVWPFHQEWFWGCGADWQAGGRFGFNIGWGFGDTSHATENMFFWNGQAHKLGDLQVDRDPENHVAPWRFHTQDGLFDLTMTPVFDNYTETKLAFVNNNCHQVFGRFQGQAVLEDGTVLEIKDMLAFCEHAVNNW